MNELTVKKEETAQKPAQKFEMSACTFCATCGSCRYYGTEGWNGFCELRRIRISSSDPACGSYS